MNPEKTQPAGDLGSPAGAAATSAHGNDRPTARRRRSGRRRVVTSHDGNRGGVRQPQGRLQDLGAGLLTTGDEATRAAVAVISEANLLVVATPTYKDSYTGVLKVLLDQLPAQALAGKLAVPVVTAGVAPQAAAAEALLRRLLVELGAIVVRPGLPVLEADLPESTAVAQKYAAALEW